ncbi:MAG: hypothetical protein KDC38_03625 [Planctomycetes bacterium]|nr:hypothetical protein [Planctomycetota bacterium]
MHSSSDLERRGSNSRLPIVALGMLAMLVAVWCVFTVNLNGVDVQNFPLILSGLLLAFISIFDLRVGLAVLLLAIGLSPEFELYGIDNLRYEDLVFPILLMIWMSRVVLHQADLRPTDLKSPIFVIVFISLISALANGIYSELDLRAASLRFGKAVEYYFMMVVVLNAMRTRRDLRAFIVLMVVSSSLVGLYGLVQFAAEGTGLDSYRLPGPRGETANILGGYFVFHMCLSLGLLARVKGVGRVLLLAYLGLMAYPFILTLSRTSYVAMAIGLFAIWVRSRNHTMGWALVLLAVGCLLAPDYVLDRMRTIADVFLGREVSSWDSRVAGWTNWFLPQALQSPLLGKGPGSEDLGAIDSEYVLQLNDLGIIGLIAFLVLVYRCMRTSWRLQTVEENDAVLSGFSLGYFGGCVALLVHSLAATTFTTIRTTEPFFFATGLLYAYSYVAGLSRDRHHGDSIEVPTTPHDPLGARLAAMPYPPSRLGSGSRR